MDYYEVIVRRNGKSIRFIKHDLSVALEAASILIAKHISMDTDEGELEIDIYLDCRLKSSTMLMVHMEA